MITMTHVMVVKKRFDIEVQPDSLYRLSRGHFPAAHSTDGFDNQGKVWMYALL
jgi:hypothetical protein